MKFLFSLILFLFVIINGHAEVSHHLKVMLKPHSSEISVIDEIKCQAPFRNSLSFLLHGGLVPKVIKPSHAILKLVKNEVLDEKSGLTINEFSLNVPCEQNSIIISYQGKINHPIQEVEDPYSRGTAETPGLITANGVVLSGGTYWYPTISSPSDLLKFTLEVSDDAGFSYMSSGEKLGHNHFFETSPQEEIYLIGAAFNLYEEKGQVSNISLSAYLRTADDSIAKKYLSVTDGFINRYNSMIGQYPYKKFDLVENFWDTGFGMPSFTLLGENIIRLPFIINTSYPHEVLHNWWGNSVYVDYQRGNWCEGITSYMADHHNAELTQAGAQYRRDVLSKYADYVTPANEFSLAKFVGRFSAASEAIGYGKSLMLFHMLREKFGNEIFKKAVSEFYRKNLFKKVSYAEIQQSFERVSGSDLSRFFSQWVNEVGAPVLEIKNARVNFLNGQYQLKFTLEQIQKVSPFNLDVPIAVSLDGVAYAETVTASFDSRIAEFSFTFDKRPYHLRLDPEFDVFRNVSPDEIPPSLTMALGSKNTYFVLPKIDGTQTDEQIDALAAFIREMKLVLSKEGTVKTVFDSDLKTIPANASIWILGSSNQFSAHLKNALKSQSIQFLGDEIIIDKKPFPKQAHSFVLLARDKASNSTMVQIESPFFASYQALAKKLVHYGKYGSLVFKDEKLINVQKGMWDVLDSNYSIYPTQFDDYVSKNKPGLLQVRKTLED